MQRLRRYIPRPWAVSSRLVIASGCLLSLPAAAAPPSRAPASDTDGSEEDSAHPTDDAGGADDVGGEEVEDSEADRVSGDAAPLLPEPAPMKLEVLPGAMARGTGRVEGRAVWLGTPDKRFIFRFSGFVHMDYRFPVHFHPEGATSETIPLVRRARFAAEGTTFGNLDYRVMFDPAVGDTPLDAYLDWRARPEFNLRVGKFKSPFGFERRARAFALAFNERAFPTLLAPNRDVGVFVHGQTVDGFFSYDVAALGGGADMESIDTFRGSPDFAGRLYVQPFRLIPSPAILREFGVGFSWTLGREDGSETDPRLGSMQSTGRDRFFQYRRLTEDSPGTFADGARRRWSVHGHYRHKRFNSMWEYIASAQQLANDGARQLVTHQGWQVYGGVALTDDEWGFFGIVPKRPFDPVRGHFGAVAAAVRYHDLTIDENVFPIFADPEAAITRARSGSLSIHWFHNQNLKAQFDAEAVFYEGGATAGADRPTELSFTARIQAFY